MYQQTPPDLAISVSRMVPPNVRCMLEPAVGKGALIYPIVDHLINCKARVTCIDLLQSNIQHFRSHFSQSLNGLLDLRKINYLQAKHFYSSEKVINTFDCIVMNPPFSGKRNSWVSTPSLSSAFHDIVKERSLIIPEVMPIECAFVLKSISLLADGGKLIAIIPNSVISSCSGLWVRKLMLSLGSVISVEQLSKRQFGRVEGVFFLLAYERGSKSKWMTLTRRDPSKAHIRVRNLECNVDERKIRFDYDYNRALHSINALLARTKNLQWCSIDKLCEVIRGGYSSGLQSGGILHTNNFRSEFWHLPQKEPSLSLGKYPSQILVQRVGRHAGTRIGLVLAEIPARVTDCFLDLRPKHGHDVFRILFWLRILFRSQTGKYFLQRGTGARYITSQQVKEMFIPTRMSTTVMHLFKKYRKAVISANCNVMLQIEEKVQKYYNL